MMHNIIVTDEGYGGLNPMQFGYENCKKSHFYGPATRTHWLIHFVESGFGIFKINEKEYSVGPGEMFVIPPFLETYYEADSKNPWSYIWIGFTTEKKLPLELPDVIHCPKALDVFISMKNAADLENGRSSFLSSRLWDLFTILLENGSSISVAAYSVGYTDVCNFSKMFKKHFGVSAREYIKRRRY